MKYKFETHAHTSEISPCAQVKACDVIKEYHDNGYSGIVITDHVGGWSFDVMSGSWKDKIDKLIKTYDIAQNTGQKLGIRVLFGIELALGEPFRDYLVYGIDYEFLYESEYLYCMNNKEFFKIAQENNYLLFAAHPFRYPKNTMDSRYLHGVEVYNGNKRHNSHNEDALAWAKKHNKIQISGSDFHEYGDITAGIYLPSVPNTISEFTDMLKKDSHTIYKK